MNQVENVLKNINWGYFMNKYEPSVVISNYNKGCTVYETIDAIKNSGFNNVFIEWFNDDYGWEVSQEDQLKYAREKGLNVIFAHLGYKNINDLWIEEETGIVDKYKKDIKACSDNNIPMVCMHLTSKEVAPQYGITGLKRIREICEYAKSLNVKVAFENTKIKGYLDYVIENIKDDNVGICFDSGHYHAHFKDDLDFSKFKDRIFCIHLHDNDGTGDQHLLPFDGTLDWVETVNKLKEGNYDGPITLEIHHRNDYESMTLDEFYKKGYALALKIKNMF